MWVSEQGPLCTLPDRLKRSREEGVVLGPTGAKATQVEGINTLPLTGRRRELTSFRIVSHPQNT